MSRRESDVRQVPVQVLTTVGWLEATLVVPRIHSLFDWFEHAGPFVRFTGARFVGSAKVLPAMTLQRGAVILVVPRDPAQALLEEPQGRLRAEHQVACLTQLGVLQGRLVTLTGVRVSDWLLHHSGFIALHDLRIQERGAKAPSPAKLALAFVNATHVIGVTDDDPPAPPPRAVAKAPGAVSARPKRAPAGARGRVAARPGRDRRR